MRFVAIVKRVEDLDDKGSYQNMPARMPVDCREFDSEAEARIACPDAEVMDAQTFQGYAKAFGDMYDAELSKPRGFFKRLFGVR
jgi:hypothetical protein